MDLINYFNGRTATLNKRYQWLMNYIKTLDPSTPITDHILLLCDNFANELMILNNEIQYRLEFVVRTQDHHDKMIELHSQGMSTLLEILKSLSTQVKGLERIKPEIIALKAEQKEQAKIRLSLNKFIRERAKKTTPTPIKNESDLKKRLPGVT